MTGQTVEEGALWYGQTRHRFPVAFSASLRQATKAIIEQVRDLLESGETPPPEYGKHCKACSLLEICQPQLLTKDRSRRYVSALFEDAENVA